MSSYSLADLTWARGFTDPAWVRLHMTSAREILPTRRVWRGSGAPTALPVDLRPDLDSVRTPTPDGRELTLTDVLAGAQTDALLVLHRGRIVLERYLHGCEARIPHFNASAAKSYLGLAAAVLEHQGQLDRTAQVSSYVPELARTAFGEARVDHLLHMGTLMSYAGRPFDKALEAQRYFAILAPQLRPFGYTGPATVREHLATARPTGEPGTEFRYENGNVEALAEVLRRVTGLTTSALLGELLWSGIGAEEDAYYAVDAEGTEAASGGFSATARDVARLGEMLRRGGAAGDRQVVPEAVASTIVSKVPECCPRKVRFPVAPASAPATLSYHDLWWIPNDPHGSYMASGIHGQRLFVSPGLDLVVVHFGAQVMSPSTPQVPLIQAFLALGTHLAEQS
ncbi:serine hydrolase [Streptomyces sp. SID14515]|uniref:serine hydrolase domain-containing protein n=1 Tax=Streptomyces sp. SID14515 TaxID=2706074 RepID=UPI0013CD3332|nr:serine hydrolase [Streptomyces sp. SID14515]NEB41542.1 serine hydrolase [Streptomyces sp. SID14515]